MSKIGTFFGLTDANDKILRLAKIMSMLLPVVAATIQLSTTFFMVFVAEALGGGSFIDGMMLVGFLIVVQMIVQTLLDYPTGAIGDWIGQRYVIASAFLCYGLAYYMVSLVNSATPFVFLIALYALMGIGSSQLSGSFNAWFDNNYRVAMPGDKDRKQYGVFWGKIGMLFQIVATAALIPGSIIAAILGRAWVFQLQAVMCVVIAAIVLRLVQDFPEVEAARQKPTMTEYTSLLKSGVSFLFSNKFMMYVTLGGCVIWSAGFVWGELILFPLYFSYLVSDIAVSSFRTILFIPGIFTQERSGVWSRKFDPKTWIPRFRLLQFGGFLFYIVLAITMFLFPPATGGAIIDVILPFTTIAIMRMPASSVLPVLLIMCTFTLTGLFGGFAEILTQRILLDVIPNKIRNGMYSLSPTIATIFAIPQIALFGWLIPTAGFPVTLASVGIVALIGVVMIRKGLSYPIPMKHDDVVKTESISLAVPAE